jgi:hypothetical protein
MLQVQVSPEPEEEEEEEEEAPRAKSPISLFGFGAKKVGRTQAQRASPAAASAVSPRARFTTACNASLMHITCPC